jgi:t-SNARE complex subunit (syntaxin)
MREREEEIRNINKGMHTVNEIYKDLAHIVGTQQDDIDTVENHMDDANKNAEAGLQQVQKANAKADQSCVIS